MQDQQELQEILDKRFAEMTPADWEAAARKYAPEMFDPTLERRPTRILDFVRSLSDLSDDELRALYADDPMVTAPAAS